MKVLVIGEEKHDKQSLHKTLFDNGLRSQFLNINNAFIDDITINNIFQGVALVLLHCGHSKHLCIEFCKALKRNPLTQAIPIVALLDKKIPDFIASYAKAEISDYIVAPLCSFDVENRLKIHLHLTPENNNRENYESFILPSLKRLDLIMESANAGMFQYSLETGDLVWDERSLEIFGYIGEYKNRFNNKYSAWKDRVHPKDINKVQRVLDHSIHSSENHTKLFYRITRLDKTEGYVLASIAIERDASHKAYQVYGFHLDLTEEYTAKRALLESENRYKQLTDTLHEIIWEIDLEGNFTFVNPAFYKTFGLELNSHITLTDAFPPHTLEKINYIIYSEIEKFEKLGETDEIITIELEGRGPNGETIYLETTGDFIYDKEGKPYRIQGLMREITKEKKQREQIAAYQSQLEKMVEERTTELEQSQKELRLIFDRSPNVMILLNEKREIININKTGVVFTGEPLLWLIGQPFGAAFKCVYAENASKICGTLSSCTNCAIMKIVNKTFIQNIGQSKIETEILVKKDDSLQVHTVNVTTTIISSLEKKGILLTIDDITEQKKVLQALEESEEKYRKLFETKNEAVFFLDTETMKYVDMNRAACQLYGYSHDELLEMGPADLTLQLTDTETKLTTLVQTGKNQSAIKRLCRHKNGKEVVVEIQNTIFKLNGRKTICSSHRDITARQKAINDLQKSEERYRHISETISDFIYRTYIVNGKPHFSEYGPVSEKITGYKPHDFEKDNRLWYKMIHKKDRALVLKVINTIIKEKSPHTFEHRIYHKNGEVKWIKNTIIPFFNERGDFIEYEGIISDITQQKTAEIALKRSEQTFRMLVENIDDIFWLLDVSSNKLVYISPQREKLLGKKPDDLLNDYMVLVKDAHPADQAKLVGSIGLVLKGERVSIEYRTIAHDGTLKWLLMKSCGFLDSKNYSNFIFGLVTDITHQKTSERNVLHAILETENREREIFAKELHDGLGATLSAIKMSLEMLNSEGVKPEKKEFYSQYSLNLITQAASTAREISHNLKPHVLVNLGLVESIEILRSNINGLGNMNLEFKFNCPGLKLDDEMELAIYRILSELCNNSLKYAHANEAAIDLLKEGNKLIITYSDNGKGFSPEKAIEAKGSGLKNIIARTEALGGEIDIASEIDEGMTTTIELSIEEL